VEPERVEEEACEWGEAARGHGDGCGGGR
jgi:hypothetical protein